MIRVFKFGGASVKDAGAVRNAASIVESYGKGSLVLIVSAMGKTTTALERIHAALLKNAIEEAEERLKELIRFHTEIALDLFETQSHPAFIRLNSRFTELQGVVKGFNESNREKGYDLIVHYGELISTEIVSEYFTSCNIENTWLDAREMVITDEKHCDAYIKWSETQERIEKNVMPVFKQSQDHVAITQGFIGSSINGSPVTLGREGSDFTAAIFGYCLNATEVVIWKDVPGLLNADPKLIPDAVLLKHISYREAVELAFFGASIIHPKTIKPLENKKIPLRVKSFIDPALNGSLIDIEGKEDHEISSLIFKFNQVLVSIMPRDLSFINEQNLSEIFSVFSTENIRIQMMQNSAISFSVCFNYEPSKLEVLIGKLQDKFRIRFNENVELITIRHYKENSAEKLLKGKKLLLEQRSRVTLQMVVKNA